MRGRVISEETRKRMSGHICSVETRKKISEAEKGKIVSEETRKKISEAQKGKIVSEKTRRKHSLAMLGKKNPNYGKIFSEEERRNLSIRRKGKMHSEETKRKMSQDRTGKKNAFYGKRHSEESKKKMREKVISEEQRKRHSKLMKGRRLSEETKKKISEWGNRPENVQKNRERRAKLIIPRKDSKPELLVQSILKKHEISFKKHRNFKLSDSYHQADIVIEPNHIIEVFGDYWHYNPKQYDGESMKKVRRKEVKVKEVWKYDKYVIDGMKKQGYKVLVVWESELKNELEKTTEKILKFV